MRRFAPIAVVLAALTLISTVSALQAPRETKTRTEVERIPYEVKYVFDRDMGVGRIEKAQFGVDGEVRRTYAIVTEGDQIVAKKVLKEERTEPVPAIFHMGKPSSRAVSRGTYTRAKAIVLESTAYTPDAGLRHPTFRTRTGTKAEYGVIAVDPRVIPLGTMMYVEGYGFGIAEDTGGAIKGNIIDVCVKTFAEADRWGRRQVRVHIFQSKIDLPPEEPGSDGSSKSSHSAP